VVNDRGPTSKNRDIDLSYAAAKKIGITGKGYAQVRIEYVGERDGSSVD
jgi:rare lipoprotein A